jgi:hypothetical protein
MAYAFVMDVPEPIEFYDALHAELGRRTGSSDVEGLLVHLSRPIPDGFQVIEVWESKELCDRYVRELVGPALAELSGDGSLPAPVMDEFEPRGLVLPAAHVFV